MSAIHRASTTEIAAIESRAAKAEATVRRQRVDLADQYERLRAALKEVAQAKAELLQSETALANAESHIAELATLLRTVRYELAGDYTGPMCDYGTDVATAVFNMTNAVQQIDEGLEVNDGK